MANNTISQVEINGTTYDLLDANTLDRLSDLETTVTQLQSSVASKANSSSVVTSITKDGLTFRAKNSSGTQLFTFAQQDNNTTYGVATTSANGLMSAADKTKLNKLVISATEFHLGGVASDNVWFSCAGTITYNGKTYDSFVVRFFFWGQIGIDAHIKNGDWVRLTTNS